MKLMQFGRYTALKQLNQGGMGQIYLGWDEEMERNVIIKAILPELQENQGEQAVEMFRREARTIGEMRHPNLATVYDFGCEEGHFYLVMEFLDGESLGSRLRRKEPIELDFAMKLISAICRGLAHAHKRDVIHRDIKPDNVFITRSGDVKILDFGLAKWLGRGADPKVSSIAFKGTPRYASPEQQNWEEVDFRTDIYLAGRLFHELLCGRDPSTHFSEKDEETLLSGNVPEKKPLTLSMRARTELTRIFWKALNPDMDKRYPTITHLERDLTMDLELRGLPVDYCFDTNHVDWDIPPFTENETASTTQPMGTVPPDPGFQTPAPQQPADLAPQSPPHGLPVTYPEIMPMPTKPPWPKILVIALLIMIVGAGAGYAYWQRDQFESPDMPMTEAPTGDFAVFVYNDQNQYNVSVSSALKNSLQDHGSICYSAWVDETFGMPKNFEKAWTTPAHIQSLKLGSLQYLILAKIHCETQSEGEMSSANCAMTYRVLDAQKGSVLMENVIGATKPGFSPSKANSRALGSLLQNFRDHHVRNLPKPEKEMI